MKVGCTYFSPGRNGPGDFMPADNPGIVLSGN